MWSLRYIGCWLTLLLLPYLASSQNAKVDSLKKVLTSLPPEGRSFASDTARVLVLKELSTALMPSPFALDYINSIEKILNRIEWPAGKVILYNCKGHWGLKNGSYYQAIEDYYEALRSAERINRMDLGVVSLRFLGDCYHMVKQYVKAVEFLERAEKIHFKLKNTDSYLLCSINIGMVQIDLKQYDRAESKLLKALKENQVRSNPSQAIFGYCFENFANLYYSTNQKGKAEYYVREAIRSRTLQGSNEVYELYPKLAIILLDKGLLNEAEAAIKIALANAEKVQGFYKSQIFKTAHSVYKAQNNPQRALDYYEEYVKIKEREDANIANKRIEGLQFQHQSEKQKLNIELLNQEMGNERRITFFLLGFLLLFSVLSISLWLNIRKVKRQALEISTVKDKLLLANNELSTLNQTLEARVKSRTHELTQANESLIIKNKEIEEALLKGQRFERERIAAELHDNLGSTITGLKWQLEAIDFETLTPSQQAAYRRIADNLSTAYSEVRSISHNMMPKVLAEKGLDDALQKLVDDMNMSNAIHFYYHSEIYSAFIEPKIEFELYAVVLELSTNIIKHSSATEAFIKLIVSQEAIGLVVADNGKGMTDAKRAGMGIANIKKRVQSLNGEFSIAEKLAETGTKVVVTIPTITIEGQNQLPIEEKNLLKPLHATK
jgi:signal transduction histidine kinase